MCRLSQISALGGRGQAGHAWRRSLRFCSFSAICCWTRSRGVAALRAVLGVVAPDRGEDASDSGLGASDSASSLGLHP